MFYWFIFNYRAKEWAKLTGCSFIMDVDPEKRYHTYRLCSEHFLPTQYVGNRLMHNALPTIFKSYLPEDLEFEEDVDEDSTLFDGTVHRENTTSQLVVDQPIISPTGSTSTSQSGTMPSFDQFNQSKDPNEINIMNNLILELEEDISFSRDERIESFDTEDKDYSTTSTSQFVAEQPVISSSNPTSISKFQNMKSTKFSKKNSISEFKIQTEQELSSNTPITNKLRQQLTFYENSMKKLFHKYERTFDNNHLEELFYKYETLKNDSDKKEYLSSTFKSFQLLCYTFLKKDTFNYIKIQSELVNLSPQLGHKYSYEIYLFAFMVHFIGPKVYTFLQKFWNLPPTSTLKSFTEKWEIKPGLNDKLFKVLLFKAHTMSPKSKECILCFDEMPLKSSLFYDFKRDEIIGFRNTGFSKSCELAKSVMVVMIRGLHDSWELPIAYFFVESSCTGYDLKNIIFFCISQLDSISINVKVMISNSGPNFQKFEDTMKITHETPYFNLVGKEIVYMYDPYYLLKTTRNNFFKYRFKSGNKIAEKVHLQNFYDYDKSRQYRLAPALTDVHMNSSSLKKNKIKYVAQIFSQKVIVGMETFLNHDPLYVECKELYNGTIDTISFIYLMNQLFDTFISRPLSKNISDIDENGFRLSALPFTNSAFQIDFLNSTFDYFKNLKLQKLNVVKNVWIDINKSNIIKFIDAWLVTIAGLHHLYQNLSNDNSYDLQLSTYKLNLNCFENFFKIVRNQNSNYKKPTCIQFKRAFKKIFSTHYFKCIDNPNCVLGLDDILNSIGETSVDEMRALFPEKNQILLDINTDNYKSVNLPEQNALMYMCGYLINECLKVHECPTCLDYACSMTNLSKENFYINFKSHLQDQTSSLMTPNSTFCEYILQLNEIFIRYFISLAPQGNVGKTLKNKMFDPIFFYHPCKDFPKHYLINLYLRFRIYHTLYKTNKTCCASIIDKNKKVDILCNL